LESDYDVLIRDQSLAWIGFDPVTIKEAPALQSSLAILKSEVGLLSGLEGFFEENLLD
jgi:hypothetical protein